MPYNLSIPGQVSVYQLQAIELVASLVPKNGIAVEVGSLFGKSSWAWAKSVDPSAHVYCIDPWEGNRGVRGMEQRLGIAYGLEQFNKHVTDCANLTPLQGYSPRDFLDWDRAIDLYYEDAVHTDPILSDNLRFWSAKLKPSGILCGDDYRPRFPDVCNGVHRLAAEFGRELITVEFFWCLLPGEALLPGSEAVAEKLKELRGESEAARRKAGFRFSLGSLAGFPEVECGSEGRATLRLTNESLDSWPTTETSEPLRIAVRIARSDRPNEPVLETVHPLDFSRLEPDTPREIELPLPIAALPAGRYSVETDLVDRDGTWIRRVFINGAKTRPQTERLEITDQVHT
jgi:hypothetical protein